jgi:drug/metabolite transporter (DMT)-like permease
MSGSVGKVPKSRRPTMVQRWFEQRFPGYRYGVVLVLLFATYVFMASGPTHVLARVVTVALQGATLLATLIASRVDRRLFRVALVVVIVAIGTAAGSALVTSSREATGVFFALNVLLVGACPIVIVHALLRRRRVDIHTVLGAICVYVLIGMIFSFIYAAVGEIEGTFFAQTQHATLPDFLYFSFVTQTTVGYGDLSASGDLGRALAAFEAMVGQLYLVTVVALVVANMARARRPDVETAPDPIDESSRSAQA